MRKSEYRWIFALQRAAGGGIAAGQNRWEWASEGELKRLILIELQETGKQAGEGTPLTKYAYDGTYEWVYKIPSRVAPQELMIITLVPAIFIVWDKGIFLCETISRRYPVPLITEWQMPMKGEQEYE